MSQEVIYFEKKGNKILGFGSLKDLKDGKYKITEVKRIRSEKQNRMYWGYIIPMIIMEYEKIGVIYTKEELHTAFKYSLLPRIKENSDFSKKYVWRLGSTAKLKTPQFKKYIDRIKILAEFGKLGEIKYEYEGVKKQLHPIEPFVIPDIDDNQLLEWIDQHGII